MRSSQCVVWHSHDLGRRELLWTCFLLRSMNSTGRNPCELDAVNRFWPSLSDLLLGIWCCICDGNSVQLAGAGLKLQCVTSVSGDANV
jgi:hypothetical protein